MTPRGGPTLDFSLFGRYFLDLAVFYPGAFLCLAPLWEHVKAPRRTAVLTAALVTVICLAAAALCAIFELDSNILLLPTLLAAFWLLRWRVGPEVSVSQTAFLFAVSGVMMAVCSLLSVVLNKGISLDELPLEEYKAISPVFENDIYEAISMKTCVEKRMTIGAPGPDVMEKVIAENKKYLEEN